MKTIKKKSFFAMLLALGLLTSTMFSCGDDNKSPGEHDPDVPVGLTDFYPIEGGFASKMILNGSNFGTDISRIKVYFNEKRGAVVNSIGDKLYVLAPKQPGDVCTISVVVGKDSVVYANNFIYHTMTIVSTICGKPGTKDVVVGTLAETEFPIVTYLTIDDEDNLFVGSRGSSYYDDNKYVMLNEQFNMSTIIIPNTGAPANQPAMLDDGKTAFIPIDNGKTYWTISSENMWKPRKREIIAKPGHTIDIDYKHAFAMCYADGHMYIRAKKGSLIKMDPKTSEAEVVDNLMATSDSYLRFSPKEPHILYLAYTNRHCIYTYNILTKEHALFAGSNGRAGAIDGDRLDAEFNQPRQMIFDEEGNIYLADTQNHTIRKISPEGIVSTVIGQAGVSGYEDGTPADALFNEPQGVAISKSGVIYIGDSKNNCVRKLAIQ